MKIRILKEDIKFGLIVFFLLLTLILIVSTYLFMSIAIDLNNVIEDYKSICDIG